MDIGLEKHRYYIEILNGSKLFMDLPHSSLNELLEIASSHIWPKKTCILDTHQICYKFYIIISGRIKVYNFDMVKDRQLTLHMLQGNDVFDIFSLIDCVQHQVYYETIDEAEVLSLPLPAMKLWISNNPSFNTNFLAYVIEKMCYLQKYVADMVFQDAPSRLAYLIYRNLNFDSNELEAINDLTHQELAAMIGTTRAVINRHLQNFKEDGILSLGRRQITVLDITHLKAKFQNGIN